MRFELEPYHRNLPDEDYLADIRSVASRLAKNTLTISEYNRDGKYSASTIIKRFGGWPMALRRAGLEITHYNAGVPLKEALSDLQAVARRLGKNTITQEEYRQHGKYSAKPLLRQLGSWFAALKRAGLQRSRVWGVTNEEYFENIEQMWVKLGRQPHYAEVQKPFSKYSAGAYERRFGTWRKALEAFVVAANDESAPETQPESPAAAIPSVVPDPTKHRTSRDPGWRRRFLVMRRDNFRCRLCGAVQNVKDGISLEIDHIVPWPKGGETVMENLQTLCNRCNIGKSDLAMNGDGEG